MSRLFLRVTFTASVLSVVPLLHAQQLLTSVNYSDINPVDPRPVKTAMPQGTVETVSGAAVPNARLGIFTESKHKLVATSAANGRGL